MPVANAFSAVVYCCSLAAIIFVSEPRCKAGLPHPVYGCDFRVLTLIEATNVISKKSKFATENAGMNGHGVETLFK
jgi:hypothetical protein